MNKVIKISIIGIFLISLTTGCGCEKQEENNPTDNQPNENQTVIEDQIYEGLEFVNVGVSNGVIKTVIINNTGVIYEGSKFTMKIMDENGDIITDIIDEIKTQMENGTTQTIETKTDVDLSKATSIEYSIVKE